MDFFRGQFKLLKAYRIKVSKMKDDGRRSKKEEQRRKKKKEEERKKDERIKERKKKKAERKKKEEEGRTMNGGPELRLSHRVADDIPGPPCTLTLTVANITSFQCGPETVKRNNNKRKVKGRRLQSLEIAPSSGHMQRVSNPASRRSDICYEQ